MTFGLTLALFARPGFGTGNGSGRFKAVVFDGFPIFDVRPIGVRAERLYPGQGAALVAIWRVRQFEYQWLRLVSRRYADFKQVTEDSLVFAARCLNLELTDSCREQLVGMYQQLTVWPDVAASLRALNAKGMRLGILSNMTGSMLTMGLEAAGLAGQFEQVLSTDAIGSYKPSPESYKMALDRFGLERHEVLFVAFAGWDAAGAKSFGYPTFWMNRLDSPSEQLDASPDQSGADMRALLAFIG